MISPFNLLKKLLTNLQISIKCIIKAIILNRVITLTCIKNITIVKINGINQKNKQ